jgi:hypothetical protein
MTLVIEHNLSAVESQVASQSQPLPGSPQDHHISPVPILQATFLNY